MLRKNQMHVYQKSSVPLLVENEFFGLLYDMGLGKSIICLTAINELIYERFEVGKVLIIAPLRVADTTWANEIKAWEHTEHLTCSKILGSEKQRLAALKEKADIYTINRENIPWLCSLLGPKWPFDMVIIDESSSFKNSGSQRFKHMKKMRPFIKRLYILTGTPAPNGLIDLWSQIYLLDQGERLGANITKFRDHYFQADKQNGPVVYSYKLKDKDNGERLIYDRIGDICISMKAEDYLELPEQTDLTIEVVLPDAVMKKYKQFEKEQVLALLEAPEITAVNAPALMNKLLQFANGAIYDNEENKSWHEVHDEKIKALAEDVEAAQGKPFMVFYQFKHDIARLMEHFKHLNPRKLSCNQDIEDWNAGKITLMLAHPKSAGHGLNLQAGGHLMGWFGVTWSLEEYMQGIKRLHRQGQKNNVINRRYVCKGTVDELVLPRIDGKMAVQEALLSAVKALVSKYQK